jgi:hypothetical protein
MGELPGQDIGRIVSLVDSSEYDIRSQRLAGIALLRKLEYLP